MSIDPKLIPREELRGMSNYDLIRIIDGHAVPTDELRDGERVYIHFSYEVVPSITRCTMRMFNAVCAGSE